MNLTRVASILAIVWTVICLVVFAIIFTSAMIGGDHPINAAAKGLSIANLKNAMKRNSHTHKFRLLPNRHVITPLHALSLEVTTSNITFNQLHLSGWLTNGTAFSELCRFYEDYVIPQAVTDTRMANVLVHFTNLALVRPPNDLPDDFVNLGFRRFLFKTLMVSDNAAVQKFLAKCAVLESDNMLVSVQSTLPISLEINTAWEPATFFNEPYQLFIDGGFSEGIGPGTLEMLQYYNQYKNDDNVQRAIDMLNNTERLLLHPTITHNSACQYNYWLNTSVVPVRADAGFGLKVIPSIGYLRWNHENGQFAVRAFKQLRTINASKWNDRIEQQYFRRVFVTGEDDVSRAGCFDVHFPKELSLTVTNCVSAVFCHNDIGFLYQQYLIPELLNANVVETLIINASKQVVQQSICISNVADKSITYRDLNQVAYQIDASSTRAILSTWQLTDNNEAIDTDYAIKTDDDNETFLLVYKRQPVLCWPKKDLYLPITYTLCYKRQLYQFKFDSLSNQLCIQTPT